MKFKYFSPLNHLIGLQNVAIYNEEAYFPPNVQSSLAIFELFAFFSDKISTPFEISYYLTIKT